MIGMMLSLFLTIGMIYTINGIIAVGILVATFVFQITKQVTQVLQIEHLGVSHADIQLT
jgi:hypothetical protein